MLKSTNFAKEHVGNRPVRLSTTYASVVILNARSIDDPRETIQTLVEFATTAPLRPTTVADGAKRVGRSSFRCSFLEIKVARHAGSIKTLPGKLHHYAIQSPG